MKYIYNLSTQRLKKKCMTVDKWIILVLCVLIITIILAWIFHLIRITNTMVNDNETHIESNVTVDEVDEYFNQRKNVSLSGLGKVLFLNSQLKKRENIFKILIWKEGSFLEKRHMKFYTQKIQDPFENCSVNNCNITYDENDLNDADAVIFLLKKLNGPKSLPNENGMRKLGQRWIFLTDDSPWNVFANKDLNDWRSYSGIFNWSMNYRIESDVPVPYGRTIPILDKQLNDSENDNFLSNFGSKRRDVLLTTLTNDCPSDRVRSLYMKELEKYLKVDIYGDCGQELKTVCSGHFRSDCKELNNYIFYLAFENSNCEEYITDNIYWNAYSKGAIPIIMGPTIKNCEMLLPPNSYLHVENFKSPQDLANYIINLNDTWNDIFSFHNWRKNFVVINEHGYHGTRSFHYCRICEALNYNDVGNKTYDDLSFYLNPETTCRNLILQI